jgi:hypothetical protein
MLLRHLLREGWDSFVGDCHRIWRSVPLRMERAFMMEIGMPSLAAASLDTMSFGLVRCRIYGTFLPVLACERTRLTTFDIPTFATHGPGVGRW